MSDPKVRPSRDNGKTPSEAATYAAVKCGLGQLIGFLLDELVTEDFVYPDTITLLTKHRVSPRIVQRLEKTTRAKDEIDVDDTQAWGYCQLIRIQQPLMATIDFITKHLPDHIVSRVDLGIDLLTRDQDDADTVKNVLQLIGTQAWRGRYRRTATYDETAYWAFDPMTTRNICAYSTRPSKIPPYGPCAHFDLRYSTAKFCHQQRGVRHAADLLKFNLTKSLHNDIRFSEICWKLAAKRVDERAREVARLMRELAQQDIKEGRVPLAAFPWVRLRGLIEREILHEFYGDQEWTAWADLARAPVQDLLDQIPILRDDCAVHIFGEALVRSRRLSF